MKGLIRYIGCILAVLVSFNIASATEIENGGIVKGIIKTSDNKPAPGVPVQLQGTKKYAISDDQGEFIIRNVNPGTYTIEVALTGYQTTTQSVIVEKDKTSNVSLQLTLSERNLSEVEVVAARNKFAKTASDYVAKLPLKNIENPQVYTSISAELMKEQVVSNYDDALKNTAGLAQLWTSTGRGTDGAGYFSLRGFAVQPTLVNGLPGLTNGNIDVANIDRIEVVKGPSGTLFGSSVISYGGLINTVTKQPYDGFGGEVSYTGGSFGLNRVTADFNTPLDKNNKVLFRVNAAYHNQNSWQDAGFRKSTYLAPSLTYKATDRLTLSLNAEFFKNEQTNPAMLFFDRRHKLRTTNIDELGYNPKLSYTSNDLSIKTPTTRIQAQALYKINDQWTSQTVVSRSTANTLGYYSYLTESATRILSYAPGMTSFDRYITHQDATTNTTDIQQNFIGDFNIGKFRNRVVVGLDYFARNGISGNTGYVANGYVTPVSDSTNNSRQHADMLLANSPITNSNLLQETYSAYISDVFNILPNLSAMASVRVDHFKNGGETASKEDKYSQTAVSPKFGLVYQPVQGVLSIFANYMNGFSNVAPIVLPNGSVQTFKPEQANQMEAGVKVNALNGKLTGSLSYYDIKVKNTVLAGATINDYTQGAKRYSKGIEGEIVANPIEGLNIVAGYAYNDSKLTKGGADYENRRPEEAGPANLANLWASYRISHGALKGFGVGFGGNYASENKILNRLTTGVFTLPSYTVFNGSIFYNTKKFGITAKLNNIGNKYYYTGWSTIEAQMPRSFSAMVSYKF
ncbi:iron complex outermembrane receptor protein [Chitinophaga skermanii]|uniref:Iron complex outermembrane receptor protein n=2 Tax=Chitinophaga skermanii TaxID=331697 RepID=A0A327R4K9_9BACT|nr:iron complex outermembrane receptor protein [Chitinophaga skermanii]